MRWRRAPASALGVLAAAVLCACGAGAGEPSSDARLLVTRDFGRDVLREESRPEVRGADTVMRLLQRNADVTTRFGGGFVQSVDGLEGGQRGGRPVDWFLYLDGTLTERGAAEIRVRDGDRIWWDHHDWGSGPAGGSAVVGAFPAPFAGRPVRVSCVPAASDACAATHDALARAGAREGAPSADDPRVVVGTYAAIRRDRAARLLEEGPGTSGVYARLPRDGTAITLLDPSGRRVRTLRAGAGLVAATRQGEGPAEWIVTGTDDAGVRAAAAALTAEALGRRFAIAVEGGEIAPLPQEAGR